MATEDVRAEYSACWSEGYDEDHDTFVIGPDNERVCIIPSACKPWTNDRRTKQDRWDIASTIARLLCEESASCRVDASMAVKLGGRG